MNLADDLRSHASSEGDAIALIFDGEAVTYAELDRESDRVASGLHKLGVRKGDRVVFSLPNSAVFVAVHLGALRAGAISVPLNPVLTAAEIRPFIASVAPRVIIAGEGSVNEVMSAGPHASPVFVVGKHATARPFDQVLSSDPVPQIDTDPSDLAVLAYTSGTSGSPKAAMLTHANLAANIDQMLAIEGEKTEPDDVVLGVLPLFHIFGLNVILGLSIRQRACVALERRFNPEQTLRSVVDNKVTVLVGAPPMFFSWLSLSGSEPFDLSGVRFAVSGASKLPPEVLNAFRSRFGVEIWEGYGLTETSPTVCTTRMGEQRPGSVGKPLVGQQIRIVDLDGNDAIPGDPGEVWVRGPNVFKGYWKDEVSTENAFAGDWFRTGDLGYLDEDGYLWLVDRKKELIIVSGFNVYPREVEDALRSHPLVMDAAVVGVPHPRQGESVKAFVILAEGEVASEEEMIVHCTSMLARYKVPTDVEFTSELPMLATGKVLKRLIRPHELGPTV